MIHTRNKESAPRATTEKKDCTNEWEELEQELKRSNNYTYTNNSNNINNELGRTKVKPDLNTKTGF